MSSVKEQFLEGFEANIESKNVASASKSTNNPPEPTVVVEPTSFIADEEVQVLEDGPKKLNVRCSRIFNWRTPDAKQYTNWAVEGGRARKAKYCLTCANQLKERDNARKRKERKPDYKPKRQIKREKRRNRQGKKRKVRKLRKVLRRKRGRRNKR